MHAKSAFTALVALSLSLSATAATTVIKRNSPVTVNKCNTGNVQCCNSLQAANDPATSALLGLLGISAQDIDGFVGVTCSPISVIGAGQGANCVQQPVCCSNNNFNGVVSIGCTPISL